MSQQPFPALFNVLLIPSAFLRPHPSLCSTSLIIIYPEPNAPALGAFTSVFCLPPQSSSVRSFIRPSIHHQSPSEPEPAPDTHVKWHVIEISLRNFSRSMRYLFSVSPFSQL